MVNNYPEYAAGVNYKKTDTDGNRHFYSAQVVADPANETVESKLIKDGVVIDEGGGGGASDLSTAEVIVINQTELPVSFETALIVDEYDEKVFTASATVFGGQTKETEVVLYNGVSVDPTLINSHEVPVAIAVTGDIEIVEDYVMIVTGAGTITITAESET